MEGLNDFIVMAERATYAVLRSALATGELGASSTARSTARVTRDRRPHAESPWCAQVLRALLGNVGRCDYCRTWSFRPARRRTPWEVP